MALQQVVLPPDALTLAKAQLKLKGPLQGTNYSDEYDYYALQTFRYKSNTSAIKSSFANKRNTCGFVHFVFVVFFFAFNVASNIMAIFFTDRWLEVCRVEWPACLTGCLSV